MTQVCERLIDQIESELRLTATEHGLTRLDPRVAQALREVPREEFVPKIERSLAYLNHPLPIGHGQTISQPFIVALMSQLLDVAPGGRVFELGTGCGYQAAILAAMGMEVYSTEIVPELAEQAAETLTRLGVDRVHLRSGDAWQGWPDAAPFDGILLTAAAPHVPERLVDQLKPGGRLLVPLGLPDSIQQLALCTKLMSGELRCRNLLPVRFVPVTGAMEP